MENKKVDYTKCMAVTGFNTKQVWVYDNEHDTYIDPPKCVVDEVEETLDQCNTAIDEIAKQNFSNTKAAAKNIKRRVQARMNRKGLHLKF
jgi:hypothetical protein